MDHTTGHAGSGAKKYRTRSRKKVSGRRFNTQSVGLVKAETFLCLALSPFTKSLLRGLPRKHHDIGPSNKSSASRSLFDWHTTTGLSQNSVRKRHDFSRLPLHNAFAKMKTKQKQQQREDDIARSKDQALKARKNYDKTQRLLCIENKKQTTKRRSEQSKRKIGKACFQPRSKSISG